MTTADARPGFPPAFYDRLESEGLLRPGMRVLDLGTGAGSVALEMARRGAEVLGMDPSPSALAAARRAAAEQGLALRFRPGMAERTEQPDAAFDLVVAARSWHWFDRRLAAAEARRVLRRGGALLIAQQDWIPLPGSAAHAGEFLIETHNPQWRGGGSTGFYPAWATDLALAGFEERRFFGFDHELRFTPAEWRARLLAASGIAGTEAAARFEAEARALLDSRFPGAELAVPHRVFAIWGRRP